MMPILDFTEKLKLSKRGELNIMIMLDMKNMTQLKPLLFLWSFCTLYFQKGEKHVFLFKNGLTACYL